MLVALRLVAGVASCGIAAALLIALFLLAHGHGVDDLADVGDRNGLGRPQLLATILT
jgi:hypothetical protein